MLFHSQKIFFRIFCHLLWLLHVFRLAVNRKILSRQEIMIFLCNIVMAQKQLQSVIICQWHLCINKVIALRGSTPKRESQQQCVCTINTAKPCHAMPHHDIQRNAIQPVQCNLVPYHATSCPPCQATPYGMIPRHSMQCNATPCHKINLKKSYLELPMLQLPTSQAFTREVDYFFWVRICLFFWLGEKQIIVVIQKASAISVLGYFDENRTEQNRSTILM